MFCIEIWKWTATRSRFLKRSLFLREDLLDRFSSPINHWSIMPGYRYNSIIWLSPDWATIASIRSGYFQMEWQIRDAANQELYELGRPPNIKSKKRPNRYPSPPLNYFQRKLLKIPFHEVIEFIRSYGAINLNYEKSGALVPIEIHNTRVPRIIPQLDSGSGHL